MNRFIKNILGLSFYVTLTAASVFAQSTLNVDVNGNGSVLTTNGSQPLAYQLMPDPTGGLSGWNVLVYSLMFSGTSGDVLLFNPAVSGNPLDCVIRFDGSSNLIFYASSANGYNNLAATPGPPDPLLSNQISLNELNNGQLAYYTPTLGQPGYDAANPNYTFYLNASPVPEPSRFLLMLTGVGIFGLARLRLAMRNGRQSKES